MIQRSPNSVIPLWTGEPWLSRKRLAQHFAVSERTSNVGRQPACQAHQR